MPDQDDADPQLLRKLASDDAFDREEAIEHLRSLPAERLVALSRHSVRVVRFGVAFAIVGRPEPELAAVALELASDRDQHVRQKVSEALARHGKDAGSDELVSRLVEDPIDDVALPVVALAAARPSLHGLLQRLARNGSTDWDVRSEIVRELGKLTDLRAALSILLRLAGEIEHEYLARECAGHAEKRLGELGDADAPDLDKDALDKCARALRSWSDVDLVRLKSLLDARVPVLPDLSKLEGFGRDLSADAERGALPRAFHVGATVEAIERVLDGAEGRSVVLAGPTGVGKTAVVHELVHRLARHPKGPVRVVRVAPGDLLVGTKYLGEWQTRVKDLIRLVAAPQRVVLYVPGLAELTEVGTHDQNEQGSAAAMLAPEIESGRIAIVGETTPDAWSRGMGGQSSFQRLFSRVDVPPLPRAQTREVLELAAIDAGAEVESEALDVVLDVADMYLSDTELPGRAVGFLRRMLAQECPTGYGRAEVLQTLQDATGVPPDFLDDSIPVTPEKLRAFFEARVMGQSRAVDEVIDLCTLVKAGLDDPRKPSGVLLFVGPTGVGKTELSRALAELLFGDPARLARFDMSEYASFESYQRLIGTKRQPGTLTEAVRRQPFSVVLLDEIEKAHVNVFDLCLQIFDAGRLTDGAGRTVSFRKAIVVMTSNLGARVQTEAGIGFDGSAPPPPGDEEIQRALRTFFRPEFLGRVDRVVRFDALSPDTADRIARREAAAVLDRSGLQRRDVSVDVDASVYGLLLRKGYSPALGARPLKRAVETHLLLPVARVLAAHEAPAGACIRLVVVDDEVRAKVLAPEVDDAAAVELAPVPEVEELVARVAALGPRAEELDERRSAVLARSNEPSYWDDSARAGAEMDVLRQLEGLLERLDRLEKDVEVTRANPNARTRAMHVEREVREVARLERLFAADDLGDAYVRLTAARSTETTLEGVERLARMYVAYARRQGMDSEVLDDRRDDEEDTITLAVRGTGAFVLLAGESGLHKLRRDAGDGRVTNEVVRVDVLARGAEPATRTSDDIGVEVRKLRGRDGRLVTTLRSDVHLVHRPTMTSIRAWSPARGEDAAGRLMGLLRACVAAPDGAARDVVRRYGFGRQGAVRDQRTGRSTGRVDRVLGGELHLVADL